MPVPEVGIFRQENYSFTIDPNYCLSMLPVVIPSVICESLVTNLYRIQWKSVELESPPEIWVTGKATSNANKQSDYQNKNFLHDVLS